MENRPQELQHLNGDFEHHLRTLIEYILMQPTEHQQAMIKIIINSLKEL